MSVFRAGRGLGEGLLECGGSRCRAGHLLGRLVECPAALLACRAGGRVPVVILRLPWLLFRSSVRRPAGRKV